MNRQHHAVALAEFWNRREEWDGWMEDAFKAHNVEFVTADWTNEVPGITKVLAEFGLSGVPFYLLYPADPSKPPLRLGDGIITPGDILGAIEKLK